MDFTITGTIHKIFESDQKSQNLTVREFRVKTDGQYAQTLKFQLINDRCDLIESYHLGQKVAVTFNIRGKENQEGKCYVNLTAWKVQPAA